MTYENNEYVLHNIAVCVCVCVCVERHVIHILAHIDTIYYSQLVHSWYTPEHTFVQDTMNNMVKPNLLSMCVVITLYSFEITHI